MWRDLEGDIDEFYEFVAIGTNGPTQAFFLRLACIVQPMNANTRGVRKIFMIQTLRSLYGGKYRLSLIVFCLITQNSPPNTLKTNSRRKVSAKESVVHSSSTGSPLGGETLATKTQPQPKAPKGDAPATDSDYLASYEAELYLWDAQNEDFINQGIVTAGIMSQKNARFQYWLTASNGPDILLAHKIAHHMNQRFSHKMHSMTWNYQADDGSQHSWLFRFTEEGLSKFQGKFSECLWETLHQDSWSKLKVRL